MSTAHFIVANKGSKEYSGDLLVILACQDQKKDCVCTERFAAVLKRLPGRNEFRGACEETLLLYPSLFAENGDGRHKRWLFVGLGQLPSRADKFDLFEKLRKAGGSIAAFCKKHQLSKIGVVANLPAEIPETVVCRYIVEGIGLGSYSFSSYKKKEKREYAGLKTVAILDVGQRYAVRKQVGLAINAVEATCTARNMANEPANYWRPQHFADFARELAGRHSLYCQILEKEDMQNLGMGGILGVNQGSEEEPRLVVLGYSPRKYQKTLLVVGKGLTFDSGGVSLKPAKGMMEMKYDMCGGAAALSAMVAIAREKPSCRVVCLVPATDNMAGGGALKPGDVITHYGGITAEIENTDAEGRLVLADALAYGIEKYQPDCIVDLATLTGAVIVALGHHYTGLMSNNKELADALLDAANAAGEPAWQLPLGPAFAKQLASDIADMKNTGGRFAGTITAAEYLHTFVGKIPWVHLDIAGTAWNYTEKTYIPKGPSGIGTRTLIEYVRTLSATLKS